MIEPQQVAGPRARINTVLDSPPSPSREREADAYHESMSRVCVREGSTCQRVWGPGWGVRRSGGLLPRRYVCRRVWLKGARARGQLPAAAQCCNGLARPHVKPICKSGPRPISAQRTLGLYASWTQRYPLRQCCSRSIHSAVGPSAQRIIVRRLPSSVQGTGAIGPSEADVVGFFTGTSAMQVTFGRWFDREGISARFRFSGHAPSRRPASSDDRVEAITTSARVQSRRESRGCGWSASDDTSLLRH
ncbi:hypothetical protein Mp_3g08160 [Marchantia polymorpha subsp. ruderalis]|uniref:Uncharacterized protein n=1 Tax=Marchantia polymorpha subsp. ruderalis TaxID=1480154 RepID=A0AAF6AYL4_MARPO|nr:hypothetical protein Mp_3g08160 [Marchantia polymorpha subsp. ruderalis]